MEKEHKWEEIRERLYDFSAQEWPPRPDHPSPPLITRVDALKLNLLLDIAEGISHLQETLDDLSNHIQGMKSF